MSITTDARQSLPVGTWALDPVHSTVGSEVDYLAGAFRGQFREVSARLDAGDETPVLTGSAKVASVDVKDENLAAHLRPPDSFEVHPSRQPTFDPTAIDRAEDRPTVRGATPFKGAEGP